MATEASLSAPAAPSAQQQQSTADDNHNPGNDDDDDDDDGDDDNDENNSGQHDGGAEGDEAQEGQEEDDASLVQVGWECLECARVIFSRLPDSEDTRTRQANVHFELGSLYLETEQLKEAEEELGMSQCLIAKLLRGRGRMRPSSCPVLLSTPPHPGSLSYLCACVCLCLCLCVCITDQCVNLRRLWRPNTRELAQAYVSLVIIMGTQSSEE